MEKKFFLLVRIYDQKANFEIIEAENQDEICVANLDYIREISPAQMNNLREQLQKVLPELV